VRAKLLPVLNKALPIGVELVGLWGDQPLQELEAKPTFGALVS
jgi:hypothetical protein